MLAAGDTFRAAAIEQLQIWAERTGAAVRRAAGRRRSGRRGVRCAQVGTRARHRRVDRRHRRPAAQPDPPDGGAEEGARACCSGSIPPRRTRCCWCSMPTRGRTRSRRRVQFHAGGRRHRAGAHQAGWHRQGRHRDRHRAASSSCRSASSASARAPRTSASSTPRRSPPRWSKGAGHPTPARLMILFERVSKRYPNGREALQQRELQHRSRRDGVPHRPLRRRQEHGAQARSRCSSARPAARWCQRPELSAPCGARHIPRLPAQHRRGVPGPQAAG